MSRMQSPDSFLSSNYFWKQKNNDEGSPLCPNTTGLRQKQTASPPPSGPRWESAMKLWLACWLHFDRSFPLSAPECHIQKAFFIQRRVLDVHVIKDTWVCVCTLQKHKSWVFTLHCLPLNVAAKAKHTKCLMPIWSLLKYNVLKLSGRCFTSHVMVKNNNSLEWAAKAEWCFAYAPWPGLGSSRLHVTG